jgi:dynein heavy chain 2
MYFNSVFFSDRLVSDNSTGVEVIAGTPLRMPSNPEVKAFNKIISQLPDVDAPYVFSLPDNIERSLQRTNSTNLIRQLRILSSSDAEASKYDREKWRAQLTPIMDLWTQMLSGNPGIVSRKVGREVQQGGGNAGANNAAHAAGAGKQKVVDPVDDFVMMEYELAGEICGVVDASLSALKKVLFGSGLLTPAIQTAATALLAGTVPNDWKKHWEASPEKPQAWLRELVRKRLSLAKWKQSLSKGGSTGLLSTPLSLSDLFNPGTFINALRQQTARHLNTAIDLVKMICSWEKNALQRVKQDCPLPCILSNFLLQGAIFQNGTLQESAPEGSELTPISDVCIGFVTKSARDMYDVDEAVAVPIYLTPSREDFLTELQMPMNNRGDHDRWILAGVALFLTEDD